MQPESKATPKSVEALEFEYNATPGCVATLRICKSFGIGIWVDSWLGIVGILLVVLKILVGASFNELNLTKLLVVSVARLLNRSRYEYNLLKSKPLILVLLIVFPATPTTYGAGPRALWRFWLHSAPSTKKGVPLGCPTGMHTRALWAAVKDGSFAILLHSVESCEGCQPWKKHSLAVTLPLGR